MPPAADGAEEHIDHIADLLIGFTWFAKVKGLDSEVFVYFRLNLSSVCFLHALGYRIFT